MPVPSVLKNSVKSVFAIAAITCALLAGLTGCSLGTIALSGPAPIAEKVSLNVKGSVFGGQQPVGFSTIQIYATGSGSYGAAATNLTTKVTVHPCIIRVSPQ